jgi:hypothetical protein
MRRCIGDSYSMYLMDNYCGTASEIYPFSINIPKVNNAYSIPNLYCFYNFGSPNADLTTIMNFTNLVYQNLNKDEYEQYDMELRIIVNLTSGKDYIFNMSEMKSLNGSFQGVTQYTLEYFSRKSFSYIPFTASFDAYIAKKDDYTILIASGCAVALICCLSIISIIRYSRRVQQEAKIRELEEIQNLAMAAQVHIVPAVGAEVANRHQQIHKQPQKRNHKQRVKALLEAIYIPEDYNENLNGFDSSCSVCIETFTNGMKVIRTSCKHVFHTECFKNFIFKNLYNMKCPNCNSELMTEKVIEERTKGDFSRISGFDRSTMELKESERVNLQPPNI